ncbi:hypothetical protein ACH5RR_035105 [Cinchona calisaya]|uniref:RNase H type-1 domain-containing protein n=1 Tax=Cinchona calisaya TaxID=153742 RepID=A0ABD2YG40_9GENT
MGDGDRKEWREDEKNEKWSGIGEEKEEEEDGGRNGAGNMGKKGGGEGLGGWALRDRLLLAWNHGYQKLIVSVDAICVIQFLLTPKSPAPTSLLSLILDCMSLLHRSWDIQVRHVYRKLNKVADCLAKMTVHQQDDFVLYTNIPSVVATFIPFDQSELPTPHCVGNMFDVNCTSCYPGTRFKEWDINQEPIQYSRVGRIFGAIQEESVLLMFDHFIRIKESPPIGK